MRKVKDKAAAGGMPTPWARDCYLTLGSKPMRDDTVSRKLHFFSGRWSNPFLIRFFGKMQCRLKSSSSVWWARGAATSRMNDSDWTEQGISNDSYTLGGFLAFGYGLGSDEAYE